MKRTKPTASPEAILEVAALIDTASRLLAQAAAHPQHPLTIREGHRISLKAEEVHLDSVALENDFAEACLREGLVESVREVPLFGYRSDYPKGREWLTNKRSGK